MKVSELMKLGKLLGVTDFEEALDAENPLMEIRTLVLVAYHQLVEQREKAEAEKSALREARVEKLKQETMRVLRGQAKTVGLTAKQMLEIEDEENPKGKLIEFIVEAEENGISANVGADTKRMANRNVPSQAPVTLLPQDGDKVVGPFETYEN